MRWAPPRTLREHRVVIDDLVAKHGGRLVKTTGDGVLLEFPSVVDAAECAVAVQAAMAERNQGVPEDRRMLFRIGINLGDILIEGNDILGDGVNIAARLEGIAEPGGICISSSAYDQVRGKVAVEFADLGEQRLKNIDRPVRIYATKSSGHLGKAAPNLSDARRVRGWISLWLGQHEQTLEQFQYAVRLNPLDPRNYAAENGLAMANFFLHRFEIALSWATKSMARQKNYAPPVRIALVSYAMLERIADAQTMYDRVRHAGVELTISQIRTRIPFKRREDVDLLTEAYRRAGVPE